MTVTLLTAILTVHSWLNQPIGTIPYGLIIPGIIAILLIVIPYFTHMISFLQEYFQSGMVLEKRPAKSAHNNIY